MALIESYYDKEINEIYDMFDTDPISGLDEKEAILSMDKYGINELPKAKRSVWKVLFAPIINLLIIIYVISAVAMVIFGAGSRTIPTFLILAINALVAIFNQIKAEKQLNALKDLSRATCRVIRNGNEVNLPSDKIAVGDIVLFSQGDKIPADCRIIESSNLSMDESSLTGESVPVRKVSDSSSIQRSNKEPLPLQDQKNMVFFGTFVASGRGKAVVVKIGIHTEIGKINTLLEETNTGDIPLRRKMNDLAKQLGIGVVALLIVSLIYKFILLGLNPASVWENYQNAIVSSIDLGMKVLPINLPLLTTIVLLTGVLAMAEKGVVVKEISRTESLGRVSVVCSDKTGTLTKNEMTVIAIWTPDMEYSVTGSGYDPNGTIERMGVERFISKEKNVQLEKLIISAYLNNNAKLIKKLVKTTVRTGEKFKEVYSINGLPTEGALIVLGKKFNPKIDEMVSIYEFVHEYSFDSSIKRMSKIFHIAGMYQLFLKGATEWVLPLCSNYEDKKGFHYLDPQTRDHILEEMKEFASAGFRVLAICSRDLSGTKIPKNMDTEEARKELEKDLTFLGLTVILDPPRDDVRDAVLECKKAGIKVVMITGDSLTTGRSIAEKIGIFDEKTDLAVEGKDLSTLNNDEFLRTSVYGRVSPEHKQTIVSRFQNLNKIVSMSGDGVNDALALSMADCGLAMGIQGTEVAKEAADMVITDDSFSTIVTGIREGRGLFMKIRTIIYFFVCISLMEAIILFASSFSLDPTFELFDYWQLNLLYVTAHMFPSLGFTFGNNSRTIMEEKPRDNAEILDNKIFKLILFHMLLMGSAIILAYLIGGILPISAVNKTGIVEYASSTNEQIIISAWQSKARTMAFSVLIILESVVLPIQIRRINRTLKESIEDRSIYEFSWYTTSIIIWLFLMYLPPLQHFMANTIHWPINFMTLDLLDWLIIIALCIPDVILFDKIREKLRLIEHTTDELKKKHDLNKIQVIQTKLKKIQVEQSWL